MPDSQYPVRRLFSACSVRAFLSLLVVGVVLFIIAYELTGGYTPRIPPPPIPPVQNGFADYLAAGQMFASTGGTQGALGTSGHGTLRDERRLVAANGSALARLKVALSKECLVPSTRGPALLMAPAPGYLPQIRDLGRLLTAEADVRAGTGDYAGAFDAGLDGIQMGTDMTRGAVLYQAFAGVAIQRMAQSVLVRVVDRVPAQACDRLIARIQALLLTRPAAAAIVGEERNAELSAIAGMRTFRQVRATAGGGPAVPTSFALQSVVWQYFRDRGLRDVDT